MLCTCWSTLSPRELFVVCSCMVTTWGLSRADWRHHMHVTVRSLMSGFRFALTPTTAGYAHLRPAVAANNLYTTNHCGLQVWQAGLRNAQRWY